MLNRFKNEYVELYTDDKIYDNHEYFCDYKTVALK